ncbi:MAG: hypothetical protein OXE52_18725 [Chloroflexi bacterium]|nr:hypothetical protein [Chloroflexota bacterium]
MNTGPRLSLHSPTAYALLALIAVLLVLLTLAIQNTPAPRIETEFGGATVEIRADRAWALLPGRCVRISWEFAEKLRVSVNNQDIANFGEMIYCPSSRSTSPVFDIVAANGDRTTVVLDIRDFPSELITCLVFLVIVSLLASAIYYLWTERINEPFPIGRNHILMLLVFLVLCLLCQTGDLFRINSLLNMLSEVFSSRAWQAFGLLLAGLVFTPLIFQALRAGLKNNSREDLVAIGAFLLFMLILYLPFGFDSVGHWETWVYRQYLESEQSSVSSELVSRFWTLVPHVLSNLISPQSFLGYHLVNFLMFWGKLALFYGILRKLNVNPLYAFLTTLLFMVYPVNMSLMSLRNVMLNYSVLSLLAAVFFCLDYAEHPSRLRLAGVWLAILLNVGSYEAGYAIIAVIPFLWWRHRPRRTWRNINLTVIWYLFPVLKLAFLMLLHLENIAFYGSTLVANAVDSEQLTLKPIIYYVDLIAGVYRHTLWYGWREALSAFSQSEWIMPVIGTVTFAGIIAAYLARSATPKMFSSKRQIAIGLLSGMLFILPSVGVLMWFEKYNFDLWRMYIYVPVGAAIAVIGLILLFCSLIEKSRLRNAFVICVCLTAMIPALARLYAQHAHYVNSANNKSAILLQIVEQAPAVDPEVYIVLVTEMLGTELRVKGVSEFRTGAFLSVLRVVYQDADLKHAFICIIDKRCFLDQYSTQAFHLKQNTDYSNAVIFRLNDDLSVELLRELPAELGGSVNVSYNPDRLIDTSAPIPPRALTMLASARRD